MAGLILPLIVYAARAIPTLADPGIPFDTEYTYLPLARQFLDGASNFWQDPAILRSAPGVVVYMALLGADIVNIKMSNMALGLTTVVLLFDAGRRMAGSAAAASAAWLCALSPTLISLSVWPMVEPPFLFLVSLWFWACAWSLTAERSKKTAYISIFVAGVALSLATLTRGTYMYWIPAATLTGAAAYAVFPQQRRAWQLLTLVHLLALVFVGGYIAWNANKFDKPAIATGAGAALYFGSNPMLYGQEPPFFGLGHDNNRITDHLGHLSLEGDARLTAAARIVLADTPASTLTTMYAHKAASLLFYSKSHLRRYMDRVWRITLIFLAAFGVWLGRRQPLVWALAGVAVYQWVVHIPVLYNPRYSVSALDTVLTLLAAAGVGLLWQARQRKYLIPSAVAAIFLGSIAGTAHQRYSEPLMAQLDLIKHQRIDSAPLSQLSLSGLQGNPFQDTGATASDGKFTISWQRDFPQLDDATLIQLKVNDFKGVCRRFHLTGINLQGEERTARVRLMEWSGKDHLTWGLAYAASHGPLKELRLDFECTPGIETRFSEIGLYSASLARNVRERAILATQ